MVSVIIPAYNSEKTISGYLISFSDQSYKSDYEIILMHSPIDQTPSIVPSQFTRIQYFQFEKETYPETACYYGVKHSRGDLILLIDSDRVAEKDWIIRHTHRSRLRQFLHHQYNVGSKTSQVLKIIPLPDHHIARNKVLFIIVDLALPMVKFFRTIRIILKFRPIQIIQRILSIIVLKICLIFWFFGFSRDVFSREMGGVK